MIPSGREADVMDARAAALNAEVYVESSTTPGLFYLLELHPGRAPHCTCPSFNFRSGALDETGHQSCKHIAAERARRERLRVWQPRALTASQRQFG